MEINKELLEHLDKARVELEQKTMIISDLLMKARQYMQQGNTDKANQLYLQVREIFKQIPDAFGERKMLLENQILTFYSQLVNEFNKRNNRSSKARASNQSAYFIPMVAAGDDGRRDF